MTDVGGPHPVTHIRAPKVHGNVDNPSRIQATRRYLTNARELLMSSTRADALYDGMLGLYPRPDKPWRAMGCRDNAVPGQLTQKPDGSGP
jgi:hypothetical protein